MATVNLACLTFLSVGVPASTALMMMVQSQFLLNGNISTSLRFQGAYVATMRFARVFLFIGAIGRLGSCASWAKNNDSCTPLPPGKGPKPELDISSYFLYDEKMTSPSKNAPTPAQWTRSFQGLNASSTGDNYLGYEILDSYDTFACADHCTEKNECQSINIFFERAPSIKPGRLCPNPPSTTLIKCTMWSTFVTEAKAKNHGSWDYNFERLIIDSNAYFNTRAIDPTTGLYPSPGPGQTFEYCGAERCYNRSGSRKKYQPSCFVL
ncbi:hypothetical protein PMIN03_003417 [Paraphaeosphaeria minitans]